MKTVIINASPRKSRNTAQLLKEAEKGAKAAGRETEYINLYDLNFTGCKSCLACKRKDIAEPCKCYIKDELSPVLESILHADCLIIGSPIYYSEPTGMLRCFLERITFPAMSYNDYTSVFKGRVNTAVFLTMNADRAMYDKVYNNAMKVYFAPFGFLNGDIDIYPFCDTLQVDDYSKYDMASFSEEHKRAVHETQFPTYLKKAFDVGAGV
ncbi:MAG: flavodoxin family protein [Clostridia bacterium]|nr:flavodoxin family protein [Clostridia bacterium]